MATNFPTTLDSYGSWDPNTSLATNNHTTRHGNADDAIEALEAKVGVNNSAVTSSLDYLVKSTSSVAPGHKHQLSNGAVDVTASAAELNVLDGITASTAELNKTDGVAGSIVGTSDSQTLTNKVMTRAGNTFQDIGGLVSMTVYATGSGTYTVPAGVRSLVVEIVGAGGGGGGSAGGVANSAAAGSGGGSGGYLLKRMTSLSSTYAYAVGAGGAGGNTSGTDGASGGNTTFSTLSATGGSGGNGGETSTTSLLFKDGADGGDGTNGDFNAKGGVGSPSIRLSGAIAIGGNGANSHFAGGGRGRNSGSSAGNGEYGSGGAGGCAINQSGRVGGDGGAGLIIIYEYI